MGNYMIMKGGVCENVIVIDDNDQVFKDHLIKEKIADELINCATVQPTADGKIPWTGWSKVGKDFVEPLPIVVKPPEDKLAEGQTLTVEELSKIVKTLVEQKPTEPVKP